MVFLNYHPSAVVRHLQCGTAPTGPWDGWDGSVEPKHRIRINKKGYDQEKCGLTNISFFLILIVIKLVQPMKRGIWKWWRNLQPPCLVVVSHWNVNHSVSHRGATENGYAMSHQKNRVAGAIPPASWHSYESHGPWIDDLPIKKWWLSMNPWQW